MGGIALEGVSKVFPGGVTAVDDVDLDIADGEFVVLAGGVFGHPTERLARAVAAALPGADPVRCAAPPVTGVLLLALDRLGAVVDEEAVAAGTPDERSARWAASAWSA